MGERCCGAAAAWRQTARWRHAVLVSVSDPPARLLSLPCLLPSLLQSAALARAAALHKGIRTKKSKAAAAAASQ